MSHPKSAPPRLTIAQLAELQGDADGFRGRFVFIAEHECASCMCGEGGTVNVLAYVGDGDDEDDCSAWSVIAEPIERHIAEPLARMLNATRPLLAMLTL